MTIVLVSSSALWKAFHKAEMATMIPAAGGAYTYSYAVIGELIA